MLQQVRARLGGRTYYTDLAPKSAAPLLCPPDQERLLIPGCDLQVGDYIVEADATILYLPSKGKLDAAVFRYPAGAYSITENGLLGSTISWYGNTAFDCYRLLTVFRPLTPYLLTDQDRAEIIRLRKLYRDTFELDDDESKYYRPMRVYNRETRLYEMEIARK